MPRRFTIFLVIALVTLLADQATKLWARDSLPVRHARGAAVECQIPADLVEGTCVAERVPLIDGFWDWRLAFNPGASFGLFDSQDGARYFLSVVGLLAVLGMVWMVARARNDQRALVGALGLLVGGAVGNLVDRLYFGVVTDFVVWYAGSATWPAFNVADVALVVGVGLMFVDVFQESRREKLARQAAAAAEK